MASIDPNGATTTGINRIQTPVNEIGAQSSVTSLLQAVPLWDTTSYLNIYVCEVNEHLVLFGGLAGYSSFPGSPFNGLDGIVIDYQAFGTVGPLVPYFDLGRLMVHEVGHYLNLRHLWGNNGGCSDDDLVNDTPSQDGPNYNCPAHPAISCGSADMFMNYMDYSSDICALMFTPGQKLRMLATLAGPRAGLLTSTVVERQFLFRKLFMLITLLRE